eukprot:TRINITY_DN6884_c0_g1_i1.p1 TRINITY_DN6884_c0_g1~~TRINITY_DN6884_c0_g1_i1.p1  ORF type:complete len:350 (-),score=53.18 TRINITY_DN6884_c0_g1_i1:31-1005(-)
MMISFICFTLFCVASICNAQHSLTPPMGWNSYDSFLTYVNETQVRSNALVMSSKLKSFGWEYVVIDEGWYNSANDSSNYVYTDGKSHLVPAPTRYPSSVINGEPNSFLPLAKFIHSLGLKLGIHIMRGIHKQIVENNEPIEGTPFTANQIASKNDSCVWNSQFYGINSEYTDAFYSSLLKAYSKWEIDFIKLDCVFGGRDLHSYDLISFSKAIQEVGNNITFSLSPGLGTTTQMAEKYSPYTNQYRVSDDLWDCWNSNSTNPPCPYDYVTVVSQFPKMANFSYLVGAEGLNGLSWPDLDMLPLGEIMPPGYQPPQPTGSILLLV